MTRRTTIKPPGVSTRAMPKTAVEVSDSSAMWPSRGPNASQNDPMAIRMKHVPSMEAMAAPAGRGTTLVVFGYNWSAEVIIVLE